VANSEGYIKLYITTLVIALVFPVLGYTFTNFPSAMGDYDVSLSAESLMMAGITLEDAESHNITYGGPFRYYDIGNISLRSAWDENWKDPWITPLGDGLVVERQGTFGWLDPGKLNLKSQVTGITKRVISNVTIINEYDINYNWTWFTTEQGSQLFITPFIRGQNITYAVLTQGQLNVTLGSALEETGNFNFMKFVNWYTAILIGETTWGLPSVFSWVLRIISGITVLSVVLLAKELISL